MTKKYAPLLKSIEEQFLSDGKDSDGKKFTLTPRTLVDKSGRFKVDVMDCTTTESSGYFFSTPVEKKKVLLHFTAGYLPGDIKMLTRKNYHVSVAYVLARCGKVFRLFDDHFTSGHLGEGSRGLALGTNSHSVAIEISNIGPLMPQEGGKLGSWPDSQGRWAYHCDLSETNEYMALDKPWRDATYFGKFTPEQYKKLKELLLYITAEHGISYKFLDDSGGHESPRHTRFKNDHEAFEFNGICTHINFRDDHTAAHPKDWGKWDIGPAFEWDRLYLEDETFRVPLDIDGKLDTARKADEERATLKITSDLVSKYYEHTETKTKGGFFPLGENTVWHGGLHLFGKQQLPVVACTCGDVIAARLEKEDPDHPVYYGSRNFILTRHQLNPRVIRQLLCLHVPLSYAITKLPVQSSHDGTVVDGHTYKVRTGDLFERADDPASKREAKSRQQVYPVKLSYLAGGLENARFLWVKKDGAVLREQPNASASEILKLAPMDRVTLDPPVKMTDLTANTWYPVKLSMLADTLAVVTGYKLTGSYYNFRKDEEAVDGVEPEEDSQRLGDLYNKDVLKLLDTDVEGAADDSGYRHVEVVDLGPVTEDVKSYTLKTGWTLRRQANGSTPLLALKAGDVLELVQKQSRPKYDLVKLESLVAGAKVPSHYIATKDGGTLYDEEDATEGKSIPRGSKLVMSEPPGSGRVKVSFNGGEGWIDPAQHVYEERKEDRSAAPWCNALKGQLAYVDTLTDAAATVKGKPRKVKKGHTGYVLLPHDVLAPNGKKRNELHSGLLEHSGFVQYVSGEFNVAGEPADDRAEVFKTLVGTDGTLKFDPKLMSELRDLPPDVVQRLDKQYYYSLYMHLYNDEDMSPSNEKLKAFTWIPREAVVAFTMKGVGTLWEDKACTRRVFDLIGGDKMKVIKDPEAKGPTLFKVRLEEIAAPAKETVTEVEVLADTTLWLASKTSKGRCLGLRSGDRLRPAPDQIYDGPMRKVEVIKLKNDAPALHRLKDGKPLVVMSTPNTGGKAIATLIPGDQVVVIDGSKILDGKKNAWSWVRISKLVDGTKKGKPSPRTEGLNAQGYVIFAADRWEALAGDRAALLADDLVKCGQAGFIAWNGDTFKDVAPARKEVHKGKEKSLQAYFKFVEGTAEPEKEPDEELMEKLAKGDVVGFGTPATGEDGSPTIVYPRVSAGQPLWTSGQYGPLDGERQELIHWEIFSPMNLLPADQLPLWTEAADPDGAADDYNMDCQKILDLIDAGTDNVEKDNWDQIRSKVSGDMLSASSVAELYKKPEVAEALRHYSCQFVIEWGIDLDKALPKLHRGAGWLQEARHSLVKAAQQYQATKGWVGGTRNRIQPLLWWEQAKAINAPLPDSKNVWHYNPIAFVEAYSELDLKKQEDEKAAASGTP